MNKKVKHFRSKLTIENYLKESGLHYAILRPVGFFENFNDAAHYNVSNDCPFLALIYILKGT